MKFFQTCWKGWSESLMTKALNDKWTTMIILAYDEETIDIEEKEIIGAVTYRIHKDIGGYIFMMAVKD